jgi:hypothetical protein
MTIDRRGFLANAASAVAVMALTRRAAADDRGRSVTDFGVEPNAERDQRAALRNAIHEISAAGEAVYIPAGLYLVKSQIELPRKCILKGEPGRTVLSPTKTGGVILSSPENESLQISGLVLDGKAAKGDCERNSLGLAIVQGGTVAVRENEFRNISAAAIQAWGISGIFTLNRFYNCNGGALVAGYARSLLIRQCRFEDCGSCGLPHAASIQADGDDVQIVDNVVSRCWVGIGMTGRGEITGNTIEYANGWGVKLGGEAIRPDASMLPKALTEGPGGADEKRHGVVVTANTISDCDVGIAVASAGPGKAVISGNTIVGAKNGAIRAFDGDKLVGPDLTQASAQDYKNLSIADNVVR